MHRHLATFRSGPLSAISAFETARFSTREDFWIIVAARSEDETEIRAGKQPAEDADQGHSPRFNSFLWSWSFWVRF